MMKLLLVLVGAVGVARAAVTCDECQAAAQDFVSPQLGVDGCEDILDMWYADMAGCIFNHFILEGDGCAMAGLCYKRNPLRDWTCEECTMLMSGLADYMVQEETITEGV